MSEITEAQYRKLKKQVEDTKQAADRAKGALDTTVGQLKKEFGCKGIKDAKNKLAALELEATIAKQKFERAFNAYQEEWDGVEEREDED